MHPSNHGLPSAPSAAPSCHTRGTLQCASHLAAPPCNAHPPGRTRFRAVSRACRAPVAMHALTTSAFPSANTPSAYPPPPSHRQIHRHHGALAGPLPSRSPVCSVTGRTNADHTRPWEQPARPFLQYCSSALAAETPASSVLPAHTTASSHSQNRRNDLAPLAVPAPAAARVSEL